MKTKYYIKTLVPLCVFGVIFRILEIAFAIDPASGFYYSESIIPTVFGIYMVLVILFFVSGIFFTKSESKSQRKKLANIKPFDKVIILLTSVCILASSIKVFLTEWQTNNLYAGISDVFKDFPIYILITSFISCVFLIFFVTDPQKSVQSSASSVLSLALPIYYAIRLFQRFMNVNYILSKAYGTYLILFLGFIVLSLMNLSKILSGGKCKRVFVAFGFISVFFASIHLVEFIMSFLPQNPYNIDISDSIITYMGDFLCAVMILRFSLLISKKTPKNKNSTEESKINENNTDEVTLSEVKDNAE